MRGSLRIALILLGLGGALCLYFAVWHRPWWRVGDAGIAEVAIGPVTSRHCFAGECRSASLEWLGADTGWLRWGTAVGAAGVLLAVASIAVAAMVAARRNPGRVTAFVGVTAATSVVCAVAFVMKRPPQDGLSLADGPLVYAAGIALAVVASAFSRRIIAP